MPRSSTRRGGLALFLSGGYKMVSHVINGKMSITKKCVYFLNFAFYSFSASYTVYHSAIISAF
jgi:hypothetical protein